MDEVLIRNALYSMLEATKDDATPIIRRLARVQARAALDTLASAPAGDGVEEAGDLGVLMDLASKAIADVEAALRRHCAPVREKKA